nr:restriction endonuclease [Deltaproteobacteria bacterium]
MREAAWKAVRERYHGAQFEQLVLKLFQGIYVGGRVEHWGGRNERGADLIVFTQDPLGLEFKIAVQVKLHEGVDDDTRALEQIAQARKAHWVDAGVIVTTATDTSERFEARRAALEEELGIDIKVIDRDEFTVLLMEHLGRDGLL